MLSTKYKVGKYIGYCLAAILLCVLQNTPGLFVVLGIKPMPVIAFAICTAMFEKETAGGLLGAFCGLLCDMFSSYIFGFYALMLFFFCVLAGLLTQGYTRPVVFNAFIFTLVSAIAIQYVGFFFSMQIWSVQDAGFYFARRLLPLCLYTALSAILLFFPVRLMHRRFEQLIASV